MNCILEAGAEGAEGAEATEGARPGIPGIPGKLILRARECPQVQL